MPEDMSLDSAQEQALDALQRETFSYFLFYSCADTGLIRDHSSPESKCSIAATGFGLACYAVAVERGFLDRSEAARRVSTTLEFLRQAPQGPNTSSAGYRGFFYHFLEPLSGRRALDCELSTIDTALLVAGGLMAASFFDGDTSVERSIRRTANELYERIEWDWALADGETLSHGWTPESGFLRSRWQGYSEALFMYLLALGSPGHPVPASSYSAFTGPFELRSAYGIEYLYAAPLFIHQLSHCWADLRVIRDAWMREHDLDYFENSRRATLIQQLYAIDNPKRFVGYDALTFGFTACTGPEPGTRVIDGREREFYGYAARGAPDGLDDGTLAPWAAVASLPFLPDLVLKVIDHLNTLRLREQSAHGFHTTFNPTLRQGNGRPWVSRFHYGLNQGPIIIMVENCRSGAPWRWMRRCQWLRSGCIRAGFSGGWLDAVA